MVVEHRRRSLILLKILQVRSPYRSWDCEIGVHFGGTLRLCCENGSEGNRIVGFVEDFAIGDEASESVQIGPSEKGG